MAESKEHGNIPSPRVGQYNTLFNCVLTRKIHFIFRLYMRYAARGQHAWLDEAVDALMTRALLYIHWSVVRYGTKTRDTKSMHLIVLLVYVRTVVSWPRKDLLSLLLAGSLCV
jgi:hypothetical protein